MDIRVGGPLKVGGQSERSGRTPAGVEAKLLAVRSPRRRSEGPPPPGPERRHATEARDPANARVLVLMIEDSSRLPEDLASGTYRLFLRFARR